MRSVIIQSFLEPEHVDTIRTAVPEVQVIYRPDLLPTPRFPADHGAGDFRRDAAQQREWEELLASAEIAFDFDPLDPASLLRHGRQVRWLQATSAGIGRFVEKHGLHAHGATFTTAAGVHARPLAEFVLFGMFAFAKRFDVARRQQRERRWQRFASRDTEGATLAIVGLGGIGREVARCARALGIRVIGTKREVAGVDPAALHVDALRPMSELHALLAEADYLCLVAPHTAETAHMIDEAAIRALKPGAVLINIGRGALVDHDALLRALTDGQLAGAVLDVAPEEPLPEGHPLWGRDDVILYPHSAATSERENERLTALFIANLRAYLAGAPLRNVYRHERLY